MNRLCFLSLVLLIVSILGYCQFLKTQYQTKISNLEDQAFILSNQIQQSEKKFRQLEIAQATILAIQETSLVSLPPRKDVNEELAGILHDGMFDNIDILGRDAPARSVNEKVAFLQMIRLFEKSDTRVKCWTQIKNHYVFSLDSEDYTHLLFVPINETRWQYWERKPDKAP